MSADPEAKLARDEPAVSYAFKRMFVLPGVVLTLVEAAFVVWPLYTLFGEAIGDAATLARVALPCVIGAQIMWWAGMGIWLRPISRAVAHRRRKERLPEELTLQAYRATWNLPFRALGLRSFLWALIALATGGALARWSGWQSRHVVELAISAALHAFAANLVRSVWYAAILARLRARLFPGVPTVRRFADGYFAQLLHVLVAVSGVTVAAIVAFIYYFLPISLEQYIQIQLFFPCALAFAVAGQYGVARAVRSQFDRYLDAQLGEDPEVAVGTRANEQATDVYRRAQALPYRLALTNVALWIVAAAIATWVARSRLRFELDDAMLMLGTIVMIAIGASLYQALAHRETMSPLLEHLTLRHRLPVRGIRTWLSLRSKLLLSFGGMVLFCCGLALFWGFIQYKNLVTDFTSKQADLGLAWLRSEVQAAAAAREQPPTPAVVLSVLSGKSSRTAEGSFFYYLANAPGAKVIALSGSLLGAPDLPWYAVAQLRLSRDGRIDLQSRAMAGRRGRVVVDWHGRNYDLGALAVFHPSYRGAATFGREIQELSVFFLVLFGACGGIVLLSVAQFVKPIRRLEERADGMARGELARPVSSGGEGDEIGRLTFALEDMRRALREKIRSTEEVNLDLERAVQRRTADLAKKNRELAETLEKLTRAQDQLVRAEKMASIGQLVAGIAHEINNPVNAIVNTVGPLREAIGLIGSGGDSERSEAESDVTEMLQVVQRGAQRTKAIVQALHNYSRTDDESVVEVDLNRSLDDSLELLRAVLKHSIRFERKYGEVGRVRGHAGQLNQVFMNLLTNAAQAVSGVDGAVISIETSDRAGGVAIRIRDNGPGIPPDVLPKIFDPFFTTKDVGEGSGLGLSIVHGIVERHGGSIEVDTAPGSGTTFSVLLPRGADKLAPSTQRP